MLRDFAASSCFFIDKESFMDQFVHLHTHTQFSLLDGACRIPDLVSYAKELGMPVLRLRRDVEGTCSRRD